MGWYIAITEEMRATGLTGNELLVYAVISSYSQNGNGCYYGGVAFLSEVTSLSQRSIYRILTSLMARGFIEKFVMIVDDVKVNCFKSSSEKLSQMSKIDMGVNDKMSKIDKNDNHTPINNIYINNNKDNIYIGEKSKFDFLKSLLDSGVEKSVAQDFMAVRKAKKAVNTETAFNRLSSEIMKSGLTFNDAVQICVEHSWKGFEAKWLEEETYKKKPAATSQKESVYQHNAKVMQNLHAMFHPDNTGTDEQ